MAGPKAKLKEGWKTITDIGRIKMEPPTGIGRYLGCEHHLLEVQIDGAFEPRHVWTSQVEADKLKPPPSMEIRREADNPLVFEEKGNISAKYSRGDSKRKSNQKPNQ